ncbi:hypothetical protein [Methanopyrus sp.]
MLGVRRRESKHEGEIPRDYRISSRDPFDYYFVPRRHGVSRVRKAH